VVRRESLTVPSPHGRNSIGTLESLDEESEYEDLNESQDIVFNDGKEVWISYDLVEPRISSWLFYRGHTIF